MIEEFLIKTIHQYFDFLFKGFDFKDFLTKETDRGFYCYYKKESLLVEIHYSYFNHYIDIHIYKETDINKLIGADRISLDDIIKDKKPSHVYQDYNAIMPNVIPLEKSLTLLSELLKEYATSYLNETEWKSGNDVKW